MTQPEFDKILKNHIRPFVSDVISKASLQNDKPDYVNQSFKKLKEILLQFDFDEDTFIDLNLKYRKFIEEKILKSK